MSVDESARLIRSRYTKLMLDFSEAPTPIPSTTPTNTVKLNDCSFNTTQRNTTPTREMDIDCGSEEVLLSKRIVMQSQNA
jgi:hypothetical protein